MGIGFLFLLIIYAVLILVSIIILIISIKNKSIIWILFSTIFLLFLVSFLFINKLDEVRICNDDVKNDLKFLKIDLKDNFYIIDNKIEGMPERYQYTKLKISEKDRNRLINEIKNSDTENNSYPVISDSWGVYGKAQMLEKGSVKYYTGNFFLL